MRDVWIYLAVTISMKQFSLKIDNIMIITECQKNEIRVFYYQMIMNKNYSHKTKYGIVVNHTLITNSILVVQTFGVW